jgi:hypothetical protein
MFRIEEEVKQGTSSNIQQAELLDYTALYPKRQTLCSYLYENLRYSCHLSAVHISH